jgi:hypothetical protein
VQHLSILLFAFGSILGANAQTLTITDTDVLNFALQAECLAAAFWNAAATGTNLTDAQLGTPFATPANPFLCILVSIPLDLNCLKCDSHLGS